MRGIQKTVGNMFLNFTISVEVLTLDQKSLNKAYYLKTSLLHNYYMLKSFQAYRNEFKVSLIYRQFSSLSNITCFMCPKGIL
jgi:hypothetical protein